jgi:hypothetical protein
VVALSGFIATGAGAQTLVNPDISALGDMRTYFRSKKNADSLGVNQVDFVLHELELNFAGYLNPYMRADAYIGLHGAGGQIDIHVEEASITVLRGLPWRLQFLAGKYLLDFGRINTQHPHQWPWLEWPLMHKSMLGPEGLWPVGLQLSTMQPVGETAVELSANAFMGDYFGHDHGHGDEHGHDQEEEHEASPGVMWSSRLSFFRSITYYWQAELGVSGLYGTYDPAHDLKVAMADVDWKLKWRPDTYRSVSWIVESMYSNRDVVHAHEDADTTDHDHHYEVEKVTAWGLFSALETQFRRVWIAGAYVDYSQDATIQDAEARGAGVWIGYMPAEETARFTLVYRHESSDLNEMDNNELVFQIVWALGPHQPHGF